MKIDTRRRTLLRAGVGAGLAGALGMPLAGRAQAWPSKPIRIIVTFPAGGLTDTFARAYGEHISQAVGQPVLVENKAGASGIVGAEFVKNQPADGHTLMFTISTTMIMNKVLFKSLPYDPDKDFVPISWMSAGHLPLIVHRSTGAANLAEFVEYARKNKVSLGTYAAGSYAHVAVEELNKHFGLKMEAVHYRGEAPMWQDLAAGVIQGGSGSYAAAAGVLQSGIGRPIAVPTTRRMSKLPDVATFLEQGVQAKGFQIQGWIGLFGPAGMPQSAVERLSALMVEAGKSPRIQSILQTFGVDEAAQDHKFFRRILDEEGPIWIELVKGLGLTPQ